MKCDADSIIAATSAIMFVLAVIILVSLSFGNVRKGCALKCCWGRPGCVIPLNMLDSYENRFGNALAFGATTIRCCLIVLGDNASLLGKKWGALIDDPSTPSFVGVIAKILVTVLVATAYYPLFACMALENRVVGSIIGIFYTICWLIGIMYRLVLTGECLDGSTSYMVFNYSYEVPQVICLLLLILKFVYVLQGAIRRWIALRKGIADISKMSYTEIFSDWKKMYMYQHVCNLLKGSRDFVDNAVDKNDIKLKHKLKNKVYQFKPDFKYSTRVICAMAVACYASFAIVVSLAFFWYIFASEVLKVWVYSEDFAIVLNRDTSLIKQLREYFDVIHFSFYVAAMCAAIVLGVVVINMLTWYRGHIMRLRRGDKKWLPSSIVKQETSPASLTAASMKFAGYQVGYTVWGAIILTIIFWIVFSVVGTQIIVPLKNGTTSFLLGTALRLWPALLLTLIINILQILAAKYFFLHDRGASLSINNRNAYHVTSYYLFFFNIALGLVSCLLRIGWSVIFGVLFLCRLQKSLLPRSFERKDPGYMAYVGYLFLEHTHANPVVCVFSTLLMEHCHNLNHIKTTIVTPNELNVKFKMRQFSPNADAVDAEKRRLVVRNRWHIALTLLRNPSLTKYRSPVRKMKTVLSLVKGIHGTDQDIKV